MRRLAWLSLERRSRRAVFSRSSSPASLNLSTSVQAWTARGPPGPAGSGALIIGVVRHITQERLVLNWWPKCIYYTDFPRLSPSYSWELCPNVRRGGFNVGFDRLVDGVEKLVAPTTFETAFCCLTSTDVHPPPPRFSLCSSSLAASGSYRQARSSPIAAPSERAPEAFSVLEGRLAAGFARPALTRNSLQPCNATRPPRLHRLTPAERTGWRPIPPHKHKEDSP